ncbi:hypothetical protein CKY47_19805 [Saccharothrix yanglingensis]|uniref:Secreted protein n=1 Tax=Saccharothrix yanglingensis TaxID=659496 RepID=A0ABU0X255_9PSEU|nr:hypothetical protein [Saccharothrix yanglingensis]
MLPAVALPVATAQPARRRRPRSKRAPRPSPRAAGGVLRHTDGRRIGTVVASRDSTPRFGDGSVLHGVSRTPVCPPPNDDRGAVGAVAGPGPGVRRARLPRRHVVSFPLVDVPAREGLRPVTG